MRISFVILLSLVANIMLAAAWFRTTHASPKPVEEAAVIEPVMETAASPPVAVSEDGAIGLTSQARWSDLQTEDFREFVRRLHAIGCPEETIKDLVLAKLNRNFSVKQRALWQDNDFNSNDYWKPYKRQRDPAMAKKNRGRMHEWRDLQKEKTALLVELFGVDVEKERRKEEGFGEDWGWNSGSLAYLPEAKRDAVQKYLDDFQEKQQEFYASIQGAWDSDVRAERDRLEQEKMDGLAQILTPQELREYALRSSQIASQVQSGIRGVDLTRAQYEALFDVRSKYGDSIYNWSDEGNDAETIKQIEQNKKDLQADIASTLGASKAQELERAEDYSYQQLNRLAKRSNLPPGTAAKVYDFKGAAEKAVQELAANTDLTPEQQQAARAQIKTETEQAVKAALGDKIYKRYMKNGGWWMNNLSQPPRHN
ncbi:MAG: hypothetical protein WDM80_11570 [Limisphaerales bacterium]